MSQRTGGRSRRLTIGGDETVRSDASPVNDSPPTLGEFNRVISTDEACAQQVRQLTGHYGPSPRRWCRLQPPTPLFVQRLTQQPVDDVLECLVKAHASLQELSQVIFDLHVHRVPPRCLTPTYGPVRPYAVVASQWR